MAMIVNKMIRVIPKKAKISNVNCLEICSHLAKTGGELWEKVIYYINMEENCLDIKYKSRKGRGELGIEDKKEDFDIWIISNYEGGNDYIQCLNYKEYELEYTDSVNFYCFDEIKLKGNHKKLRLDLYPSFFHFRNSELSNYLQKAFDNEENDCISFRFDGLYTAGTMYSVGEKHSYEPELVSKEEFFRPRQVSYFEAQFLFYKHYGNWGVGNFINSCLKDKLNSINWERENLHEILFLNKGRVVKKITTDQHWMYFNAEFFDNSMEKNWIEYMGLYNRGLI